MFVVVLALFLLVVNFIHYPDTSNGPNNHADSRGKKLSAYDADRMSIAFAENLWILFQSC